MHPRRAARVRGPFPDREGFSGRGVRCASTLALARPDGLVVQGGLARLVSCIGFNGRVAGAGVRAREEQVDRFGVHARGRQEHFDSDEPAYRDL